MPINIPGYQPGIGMGQPYFRSLCAIVSDFGIGANGLRRLRNGTGFLFHSGDGDSYVLTAAHNLYRHEFAAFADRARLWMGRIGGGWEAVRDMTACRVPQAFLDAGTAGAESDYAVIRLGLLPPDSFVPIGLTGNLPPDPVVRLAGYPNEPPALGTFLPFHGEIDLLPAGPANFGYADKPSYEGQSGAPLLLPPLNGAWNACGLHIRGRVPGTPQPEARAIRFTEGIFAQINAWLPN